MISLIRMLAWYEASLHFRPFQWRIGAECLRSLTYVRLGPFTLKIWYVGMEDWSAWRCHRHTPQCQQR